MKQESQLNPTETLTHGFASELYLNEEVTPQDRIEMLSDRLSDLCDMVKPEKLRELKRKLSFDAQGCNDHEEGLSDDELTDRYISESVVFPMVDCSVYTQTMHLGSESIGEGLRAYEMEIGYGFNGEPGLSITIVDIDAGNELNFTEYAKVFLTYCGEVIGCLNDQYGCWADLNTFEEVEPYINDIRNCRGVVLPRNMRRMLASCVMTVFMDA